MIVFSKVKQFQFKQKLSLQNFIKDNYLLHRTRCNIKSKPTACLVYTVYSVHIVGGLVLQHFTPHRKDEYMQKKPYHDWISYAKVTRTQRDTKETNSVVYYLFLLFWAIM